jgi:hypothetical protein
MPSAARNKHHRVHTVRFDMPWKTNNRVSISALAVTVTATVTLIVDPVIVCALILLAPLGDIPEN